VFPSERSGPGRRGAARCNEKPEGVHMGAEILQARLFAAQAEITSRSTQGFASSSFRRDVRICGCALLLLKDDVGENTPSKSSIDERHGEAAVRRAPQKSPTPRG